jgi:hypothetical protein
MFQRSPDLASWVSSLVQVGLLAHSLLWGVATTSTASTGAAAGSDSVPVVAQATRDALDAQLATAIQHAGFSMEATELDMATRHLGHVLNCLAGEDGEGFDGAWGHPCAGQGDGILADVATHPQHDAVILLVRSAHELAMEGVQTGSLESVRAAAAGVRALLTALVDFGA